MQKPINEHMKQPLHICIDDRGVCWLTLNRPHCANALDSDLVQQLSAALARIRCDSSMRLLILSGQGEVFCSGADLQSMQQLAAADMGVNQSDAFELALLLEDLASLPVPTLARINGAAFGGGIGLIAACDIAIASNAASFAFSEVRLGLVPAVIAPYAIAAIGLRQARRWFLSGERFDGEQALAMGLLHQLVSNDELDDAVEQQIKLLLKGGPQSQGQAKQLLNEWLKSSPVAKEDTAELLADIRASGEGREGIDAFLAKRKPGWLP
ncbi:MAG: enoyl-CoA hydratase-related protein [Pseudomonadales bacterium]